MWLTFWRKEAIPLNKNISRYRRVLKQSLRCGIADKSRLLSQFECSISGFQEDCPAPTYAQLEEAFGPPVEMAEVLMEDISPDEQKRYRSANVLIRVLIGLFAVLFVLFALYVFCDKEYSVIEISGELIPDPTIIQEVG